MRWGEGGDNPRFDEARVVIDGRVHLESFVSGCVGVKVNLLDRNGRTIGQTAPDWVCAYGWPVVTSAGFYVNAWDTDIHAVRMYAQYRPCPGTSRQEAAAS